ncbi:MAG TPA: hypothetical protein VK061_05670 [Bacillota bacterium]|nr:hypothetical protein [Bacillota bacterium]
MYKKRHMTILNVVFFITLPLFILDMYVQKKINIVFIIVLAAFARINYIYRKQRREQEENKEEIGQSEIK